MIRGLGPIISTLVHLSNLSETLSAVGFLGPNRLLFSGRERFSFVVPAESLPLVSKSFIRVDGQGDSSSQVLAAGLSPRSFRSLSIWSWSSYPLLISLP